MIKNLLDVISEKELAMMVKYYCDYNTLLKPIKENSGKYNRYASLLGAYKKNSVLVQNNLPKIAAELYKKWDTNFTSYISSAIDEEVIEFSEQLDNYTDKREYAQITVEEYAEIVNKWKNDSDAISFNADTFIPNLKLVSAIDTEEKEEHVRNMLFDTTNKGEQNSLIQSDSPKNDINQDDSNEIENSVSPIYIGKKQRKKTAQEKAESTRLANERKKQEQLEKDSKKFIEAKSIADEIVERSKDVLIKDISNAMDGIDEDEGDAIVEVLKDKSNVYIGMIDIRLTFYNFVPLGEWNGKSFAQFSMHDVERLIPQSVFPCINLSYNYGDTVANKRMKDSFVQDQLYVFEFETTDLEENRDSYTGKLNNIGYKVDALECMKSGKLRPISDEGLYFIIDLEDLDADIQTDKIVYLRINRAAEGDKILVNMRNGFLAGPYEVKYSPTRNSFFIKPQGDNQNYLVSGYYLSDCIKHNIESIEEDQWKDNSKSWVLYSIKQNAENCAKDVITDSQLLESVQSYLRTQEGKSGDINSLIANSESFFLVDEKIPESIRKSRLKRLETLLQSNETLTENFDQISSMLADMILRDKDGVVSSEIIDKIIETRPDFLNKIPSMRIMQERIESKTEEIKNLEFKKSQIEQEIENHRIEEIRKDRESISSTRREIEDAENRLNKLSDELRIVSELHDTDLKRQELEGQVKYLEEHKARLESDSKILESKFVDLINQYTNKMVDITFDGFISNKMIQSASEWERQGNEKYLDDTVERINAIETKEFSREELIDYIVSTVNKVRPQYSRNMIVNLLICIIQGFITVFYGTPGCGKTSICNILSKVLGLNKFEDLYAEYTGLSQLNRYVAVSVERGWTSKRDFVGYYNPLTKSFEDSNREVFDGLRILDAEARKDYSRFPFIILLDEANLSPMEYYWADFMNVCDDINDNNRISIGNGESFIIPETLHFVATINNDHTTETLSPRLVDRAWVISLPKLSVVNYSQQLNSSDLEIISWKSLVDTFSVPDEEDIVLDSETQKVYDELKQILGNVDITISPRIDIAIHKYWYVASRRMETDEYNNSPGMIAFDYIMAQKILPKINGSGESFKEWLNTLSLFCSKYNLMISKEIVQSIISKGDKQLNYYQFFN